MMNVWIVCKSHSLYFLTKTIIESKEVNDNALLLYISKELNTDVNSVVQSDATGAWGFAEMSKGKVVSRRTFY